MSFGKRPSPAAPLARPVRRRLNEQQRAQIAKRRTPAWKRQARDAAPSILIAFSALFVGIVLLRWVGDEIDSIVEQGQRQKQQETRQQDKQADPTPATPDEKRAEGSGD